MSIILIVGILWGISALCRAAQQAAAQARVERAARTRALENARRAARQAQLMEEWRQQQLAAKQETARLISAERARMAQERAERIAAQQEVQARLAWEREEARRAAQEAKEMEKAQKEAEKAAKREYERQQAEADLEHFAAMRDSYTDLIESMTAEAQASTTTDKRRNTLQRQILQLEEKVYKIDQRRAKAYYLAKGAC